ncbi:toll/interleukin-1 receptor domain-containing protein [Chryseobacterium arthrosphaerae]|uniref:toll/interleukin-1 receptor domain-containing protein n=1 Tax=Chryseobacterium arthrosphaerae TaxID=651561 RepID=UPI0031DDEB99
MKCFELEYDVVLSFAGEDRKYVEKTAKYLKNNGIKVFYDNYESVSLWGKDLYQHLDNIYQRKGKYAVIFISKAYSTKLWTNHELKSAQARAFIENEEYILPVRFDETEISGINKTVGYLSLKDLTPTQLAKKIIEKLGEIEPEEFLPKKKNYIISALTSIYEDFSNEDAEESVIHVFETLKKTNSKERKFLTAMVTNSCKHDIETDLHEDIKLIQRATNYSREEIIQLLDELSSLGFEYKIEESYSESEILGKKKTSEMLRLSLMSKYPHLKLENLTIVFSIMYFAVLHTRCDKCSEKALNRLDFSDIADSLSDLALDFIFSCLDFNEDDEKN